MKGAKAEGLPSLFRLIPKDAVFAYIKNPQNIISILNGSSDSQSRLF